MNAGDRVGEPLGVDRLHEIVEGRNGERLDRILLAGRDKHHLRASGHVVEQAETAAPGHFHVEKHNIRRIRFEKGPGLSDVPGDAGDDDLRMGGEQLLHPLIGTRFVIHEQGRDRRAVRGSAGWRG